MNFNLKDIAKSKIFFGFIIGIATLLVIAVVFQAGMFVGLKKAEFSGRLGENYGRIFNDTNGPGMMKGSFGGMPFNNLPGGHGAVGSVIKVSSSTLVVAEPNNIEKIILISDDTIIRKFRNEIKVSDILVGDSVSVIGEADNSSEIEAKFIRVLPSLPTSSSTLITK